MPSHLVLSIPARATPGLGRGWSTPDPSPTRTSKRLPGCKSSTWEVEETDDDVNYQHSSQTSTVYGPKSPTTYSSDCDVKEADFDCNQDYLKVTSTPRGHDKDVWAVPSEPSALGARAPAAATRPPWGQPTSKPLLSTPPVFGREATPHSLGLEAWLPAPLNFGPPCGGIPLTIPPPRPMQRGQQAGAMVPPPPDPFKFQPLMYPAPKCNTAGTPKDRPRRASHAHAAQSAGAGAQAPPSPEPVLSIGSVGHPFTCQDACKYVWKKRGCKDGADCSRCHACVYNRYEAGKRLEAGRTPKAQQ